MIKGITYVRPAGSAEAFEALASFFSALGFEQGKGWDDEISRGRPFLAPLGNLEFVDGTIRATADILIEVTALEDVRQVVEHWLGKNLGAAEAAARISQTADTHWKSRAFTVEPVAGTSFSFWEWLDPLKDKPAALEGDLVGTGMRFAIIVARWNAVITERLLQGALDCLHRSGVAKGDVNVLRVPGSWEIPAAARAVAQTKLVDGVIALGCLIRGETAH
jgi:6,7-dimethyl-8-ribityllumazine synthase